MDRNDFHIGILPNRPVAEVAGLAAYADELGFGGLWVADSQSVFRDAWQALAVCATRTSSLTLATGVTNPVTRHATVIAGGIATLDELSRGRAVLGIGVGESAVRTVGLRPASLRRLEAVALAIRSLLAGETARSTAPSYASPGRSTRFRSGSPPRDRGRSSSAAASATASSSRSALTRTSSATASSTSPAASSRPDATRAR